MTLPDYEKLGVFYLGRELDPHERGSGPELLYDSRDLTTHAVCIGMTGSGKTGLCVSLLEEAALDGVPAIVIDPKGDLGNLAAHLPRAAARGLRARGWTPVKPPARAERRRIRCRDRRDLAQGARRMGPGRRAHPALRASRRASRSTRPARTRGGRCRSCARSAAPDAATTARCDRAQGADRRLGGRACWVCSVSRRTRSRAASTSCSPRSSTRPGARDESLDLAADRAGAETTLRQGGRVRRRELFTRPGSAPSSRLRINGLLAVARLRTLAAGDALDMQRAALHAAGKPRISIVSIAHLNDAERMFVVTLVANELVAWMRRQSGHDQPARDLLHGRDLRVTSRRSRCRRRNRRC